MSQNNWSDLPQQNQQFLNETVACAHDVYNKALVDSGKAATIEEAAKQIRHLSCKCNKCSVKF
jgi:hypothetical protein